MAKEYNVGDRLYLPVWVTDKETNVMMGPDKSTTITDANFSYAYWHGKTGEGKVRYGEDGLLLTAEEIYANRRMTDEIEHLTDMLDYGRQKYDEIEELKSRNAELEALLKEVMATRDEAVKQNNELIADRNNWKEAAQRYHDSAKVADAAAGELRAENKKLIAESDKLKDTLADRTKDVQHLTEEGAKLKAEYDELKGRYNELDSVNKEQAEKIRKLDAHNTYLKGLLCAKKKMRIVLNNGKMYDVEVGNNVNTTFDMGNELFSVKTEGSTVASFFIGKEPCNIAGWYMV